MARRPWFELGRGFPALPRPLTWQGYLAALVLLGAGMLDIFYLRLGSALGIVVLVALLAGYVLLARATGAPAAKRTPDASASEEGNKEPQT